MGLRNLRLALVTVFVLNTVAAVQPPQPNNGTGGSTVSVVLATSPSTTSNSSSDDSPEAYLNAHNTYRAKVGVKPMTWDKVVAANAETYANERIEDCECYSYDGNYSANVLNSSDYMSGKDAVTRWGGERTYYNLESNTCAEGWSCGNYTQIIWGNSIRLGCAKVNCNSGGTFVICNYDPPGNQLNQRPVDPPTPDPPPPISPVAVTPIISPTPNDSQPSPVAIPPSSTVAEPPIVGQVKQRNKRSGVLIGSIVGACVLFSGLGFILFFFWRKRRGSALNELALNVSFGDEFGNGMGPREFTYIELC